MSKTNPTEWERFKKDCRFRQNYIYCDLAGYRPYFCQKGLCQGKNPLAIQRYNDFQEKIFNPLYKG